MSSPAPTGHRDYWNKYQSEPTTLVWGCGHTAAVRLARDYVGGREWRPTMARAELADCGHPVPDFPVFTDLRVFCTRYCREWFEPETDESEEADGAVR